MITLDNVTKEFLSREGTRVKALDGVSFDAVDSGITCIVGPTGSGKSTLLRLLAGLDQADGGTGSWTGRHRREGMAESAT